MLRIVVADTPVFSISTFAAAIPRCNHFSHAPVLPHSSTRPTGFYPVLLERLLWSASRGRGTKGTRWSARTTYLTPPSITVEWQ